MKLIVSKEAIADINRPREFLADKEEQSAQRAIALLDAIRSLEGFPGRGRQSGISGVLELVVPFGR